MTEIATSRHELMSHLAALRRCLREHDIRDASDYAEVLVAEAVGGQRQLSRVTKGHDVVCSRFGRIEVKCRQLPLDGRIEERVEVSDSKQAGFEFLAVVIFQPDFSIKGAVVVPYSAVWAFVQRQKYNRVSYPQACRLSGAVDITAAVRGAADR